MTPEAAQRSSRSTPIMLALFFGLFCPLVFHGVSAPLCAIARVELYYQPVGAIVVSRSEKPKPPDNLYRLTCRYVVNGRKYLADVRGNEALGDSLLLHYDPLNPWNVVATLALNPHSIQRIMRAFMFLIFSAIVTATVRSGELKCRKPIGPDAAIYGDSVRVNEMDGELVFSWLETGNNMRAADIFCLLGWALSIVISLRSLIPAPDSPLQYAWYAVLVLLGAYALNFTVSFFRKPAHARVSLRRDSFTYDPGWTSSRLGMLGRPRVISGRRDEVGEIRLDPRGLFNRLTIELRSRRYEIGRFMNDAERQRLRDALHKWKLEPDASPPRSCSSINSPTGVEELK